MYDQHSNAPAHLEKNAVVDMLRYLFRILESIAYFCNIHHLILLFVKSIFANLFSFNCFPY